MPTFDFDDIRFRLEALKMNQGTLRQIMTLSAGGLALYFSFIGKAPFIEYLRTLGIFVVLSWIGSLCVATVAYHNHGKLFLWLFQLPAMIEREKDFLKRVEEELDQVIDKKAFLESAKPKLEEEKKSGDMTVMAVESTFFPLQSRTLRLTSISLYFFLLGFVLLGVAYVLWTIKA